MALTKPLAYNPTLSPISGTTQVGTLAVGTTQQDYSIDPGGVKWWMGPDQALGYVISGPISGNTQPTPISGVSASVGFYRSETLTNDSFIDLAQYVSIIAGNPQTFASASAANTWLLANGYWNSWEELPPLTTGLVSVNNSTNYTITSVWFIIAGVPYYLLPYGGVNSLPILPGESKLFITDVPNADFFFPACCMENGSGGINPFFSVGGAGWGGFNRDPAQCEPFLSNSVTVFANPRASFGVTYNYSLSAI